MLEQILSSAGNPNPPTLVTGQFVHDAVSTIEWVVPDDVYSISAVLVGAGQSNPGIGGGLTWHNDIQVTPGEVLHLEVASDATRIRKYAENMLGRVIVHAEGGNMGGKGGKALGYHGGGNGGQPGTTVHGMKGSGGAGGYMGDGGRGGSDARQGSYNSNTSGSAGAGGGGGGGAGGSYTAATLHPSGNGGGVGILGQGGNGAGGKSTMSNSSAGTNGVPGSAGTNTKYGGAAGYRNAPVGTGVIRIIWGPNRAFPNTNTKDM